MRKIISSIDIGSDSIKLVVGEFIGERLNILSTSKIENTGIKDWSIIKNALKDSLHDFLYIRTKRNPLIIPIITEV